MDEQQLRALIAKVKSGKLSRRTFVRKMIAQGRAHFCVAGGHFRDQPRRLPPSRQRLGKCAHSGRLSCLPCGRDGG